ncbi:imelysin family protein [Hyphomicrobium sp.]|jgi:putative iron-regulated protein|uniref:imelysin family protein n=1 Tax=Hyphomicrobium sp. TaxID=82 RepID=UPI002B812EF0|nr:imelysin family protein [Hyphomicrobium sp.]HVZ03233.1 imelysin family protein [Hyphomicrobium sp.]
MSKKAIAFACAAGLALAGATAIRPALADAPSVKDIMKNYGDLAEAMYSDSLAKAKDLDKAIDAFLANPNATTQKAAQDAWKAARVPYMQTEGFRFGNKIVDDWEGNVNSWPLDEGLIDYVDKASYGDSKPENPLYTANIIANKKIRLGPKVLDASKIDKKVISQLNSALDVEANVGTGYHAIEFLLWGQNLHGTNPGAGERPASDYDLKNCTHANCDRRRDYLKAASSLLVDDLQEMVGDWKPDGAARQALAKQDDNQQLSTILTGIGSLSYGELAGERMKLGVLLHDPEEAHDCFSNNTQNSHFYDEVGMIEIWNGKYDGTTATSGASIADLARAKAPDAAKRVDEAMANAKAKINLIKVKADSGEMGYNQMLAAGNDAGNKLILDAVDALVAQARAVEAVVAALGLKVKIEGSDSLDHPDQVATKGK